jgi:hypothetical protein
MRILLLIAFLFPLASYTQEPPKNSTGITVSNTDLMAVANALLDNGFRIDKKDTELGTLKTEERGYENNVWFLVIDVRVKDSTAYITGQIKVMVSPIGNTRRLYEPVIYKGMKKAPYRLAFAAMDEIARSLNGHVTYSK